MKKIFMLVAVIGMISIHQSVLAQSTKATTKVDSGTATSSKPAPALRPLPAKAKMVDPLKFEYITGSMDLGGDDFIEISVLNCSDNRDEFAEIEIHTAVKSGYAGDLEPKLLKRMKGLKIEPRKIFTFRHVRRHDGVMGNPREYWVRVKASSEFLIPKVIHSSFDSEHVYWIRAAYLPGDFAVYSRNPFQRIR